jgi:hypothetical protein
MSNILQPTNTSDLDPLEEVDLEEESIEEEDGGGDKEGIDDLGESSDHLIGPANLGSSELPPEIEEEIRKVIVPEHEIVASGGKPKNNSHLLPPDLINTPLDPAKDLWDEDSGSI